MGPYNQKYAIIVLAKSQYSVTALMCSTDMDAH